MRSPTYEQALKKSGVKFEYIDAVPLSEINVNRGKTMQARLQPLDHDLIDRYAEMLDDDFDPPPLLLWKPGRGMYIPLDGNQRLAANAQCKQSKKRKSFSAYIIHTDDPMVSDRLCWTWNNLVNGRRLSYEECLEHALTFVRKYGQQIKDAAREWGVKGWELTAKVTEMEMRELAGTKRVELPINTPIGVFLELSAFRRIGDDVAINAMKTVADHGLGLLQVQQMTKEVRESKTHDAKIAVIDEFANRPDIQRHKAETKNGKHVIKADRLPRIKLQRLLEQAEYLFTNYPDKAALKPVGKPDRERYAGAALEVCNKLISIYGLGSLVHRQGYEQ